MLNIIGYKNWFFAFSGIIIILAIAAIVVFGFRQGVDFSGGTLWKFSIAENRPQAAELQKLLEDDLKLSDVRVNYDPANQNFLVRLPSEAQTSHEQWLTMLTDKYPSIKEQSFQTIGPSVGRELRTKAILAVVLVLVGISLYIAFAFRKVYRPVSSWKYGWITLFTLFHDVIIPAGLLAVLGYFRGVEIDGNFIVALLVIMGFSVHDTIVVFDRIRENLFLDRGKMEFGTVINQSINQTLARSINTSLTVILVLVALYFAGPITLRYFILTLLVGTVVGIYSSIFIASPLLLVWQRFSARKE